MVEGYSVPLYLLYQMAQGIYNLGLEGGRRFSSGAVLSDELMVYRHARQNFQTASGYLQTPQSSSLRFKLVDETGITEPLPPPVFYRLSQPLEKQLVQASLIPWQPSVDPGSAGSLVLPAGSGGAAALQVNIGQYDHDQWAVILWSEEFISLHLLDEAPEFHENYDPGQSIPKIEDILTRHGRPLYYLGEDESGENEDIHTQSIRHWLPYLKAIFGIEVFAYKKDGLWYLVFKTGKSVVIFSFDELEQKFFESLGRVSGGGVPIITATRTPAIPKAKTKLTGNRRGKSFKKTKTKPNYGQAIEQTISDSGEKPGTIAPKPAKEYDGLPCPFCDYVTTVRNKERCATLLEHIFHCHHKSAVFCPVFNCHKVITSEEELLSHAQTMKQSVPAKLCCPKPWCHFNSQAKRATKGLWRHRKICSAESARIRVSPEFQTAVAIYMGHRRLLTGTRRGSKNGSLDYRCRICQNHIKDPSTLVAHMGAVHQTPAILCPVPNCVFIFNTVQECREHIAIVRALSQKLDLYCHSNELCHYAALNCKVLTRHHCQLSEDSFVSNLLKCQVNGCSFKARDRKELLTHCQSICKGNLPHTAAECPRKYCHASYSYGVYGHTQNRDALARHTRTYHSREFHQRRKVSHYAQPYLWDMSGLKQALALLEGECSVENALLSIEGALAWRVTTTSSEDSQPIVSETQPDPVAEYLDEPAIDVDIDIEQGTLGITMDYPDTTGLDTQEELSEPDDPSGDTPVIVDASDIHGKGVFAKRNIARYQFIARFRGRMTTSRTYWDLSHCLFIQDMNGRWVLIKPSPDNPLKFLNHRDKANAVFHNERPAELYALEDIAEGTEITVNYDGVLPENLDWDDMKDTVDAESDLKVLDFQQKERREK